MGGRAEVATVTWEYDRVLQFVSMHVCRSRVAFILHRTVLVCLASVLDTSSYRVPLTGLGRLRHFSRNKSQGGESRQVYSTDCKVVALPVVASR